MCMTASPARLSNTILYGADAMKDGKYIHIIGYQNVAEDLSGKPNAMILPFPVAEGTKMGPENIIDTRAYSGFMKRYRDAIPSSDRRMMSASKGMSRGISASVAQVFESGSFTVVLAESAGAIPEALTRVPEEKRPSISAALLESFDQLYPGEPIAVCCWSGSIRPEPLLWWYEPKNKESIRLPALDAHDGGAPRTGLVKVDHAIVFGSLINPAGFSAFPVGTHIPQTLAPYLAPLISGRQYTNTWLPNGDFILPTKKIVAERPGAVRRVFPQTHTGIDFDSEADEVEAR